jgi:hypothetical protein
LVKTKQQRQTLQARIYALGFHLSVHTT